MFIECTCHTYKPGKTEVFIFREPTTSYNNQARNKEFSLRGGGGGAPARDVVYGDLGEGMNFEVIRSFQILEFYLICIILASEASKKKIIINKIKTTFGPPLLPLKHPHRTPPLTNFGGGGVPDPSPPSPESLHA